MFRNAGMLKLLTIAVTVIPVYNELAYDEVCLVWTNKNVSAKLFLSLRKMSTDIALLDIPILHLYQIKVL